MLLLMKVKGRRAAEIREAAKPPLISADSRLAKPLTFISSSIQSAAEVNAVAALDVELITSVDYSQCDQPSIRVFSHEVQLALSIQESWSPNHGLRH
jgi:hypothetical protein